MGKQQKIIAYGVLGLIAIYGIHKLFSGKKPVELGTGNKISDSDKAKLGGGVIESVTKNDAIAYANQDNVNVYEGVVQEDGFYKVGKKLSIATKFNDKLGEVYDGTQIKESVLKYFVPIKKEKGVYFVPRNQVK